MPKLSTRDAQRIAKAIANGGEFTTHGALSGESGPFNTSSAGRLPGQYLEEFLTADYALFSYATPIAYRANGRWVVPDVRYSVTTSRHQSTVRFATYLAA
jgi:hypothetical protein